ncbi:SHOCT domain-containing protein [Actinoplanes sp. DH11]|uniref:SHOCT domain-containing protein n=1 Tax=Actinoplanes sp. DH11 TaxID=2857011 RepID=UPI001E35DDF1|nr:SHOCT domain-containing protein [Actinoplanes sp. DH11]
MGLFSGKPVSAAEARARAERARHRAAQAGVDVRAALAVGHMTDGGASVYLLVLPDRLELVSTGQLGFRTGAGRSAIPFASVAGVSCRDRLLKGALLLEVDGTTVEFVTDRAVAGHLRDVIEARLTGVPAPSEALLRNLAELHEAGVLSDEEYAAKRAGLL